MTSEMSATTIAVTSPGKRHEQVRPASRSWFIARLNPVSRFICPIIMTLPLFTTLDGVSASVALGITVVLLWIGGIAPWTVARHTWPVWIGAAGAFVTVLMYGHPSGTVYVRWAAIVVSDGSISLAIAMFLRVLAVAVPSVIFLLGLDPTDLADGLVQILHFPMRFVYGALAGIRMFTLLQDDWRALGLSRRSRGLGDTNAVVRVVSQMFALLVLSIRRATKLATAMEARGFGAEGKRAPARISRLHGIDVIGYIIAIIVPACALTAAVMTGAWTSPLVQ